MSSPTARSLKLLRAEGYLAGVVEMWVPGANVRRDLFGFGDILAVHDQRQHRLLVQTTTLANISARVKKARALPTLEIVLAAGIDVEFHGWACRSGRWQVTRVAIGRDDCRPVLQHKVSRRSRDAKWKPGDLFR